MSKILYSNAIGGGFNVCNDMHKDWYCICHWISEQISIKFKNDTLNNYQKDFEVLEMNYKLFLLLSKRELTTCQMDAD